MSLFPLARGHRHGELSLLDVEFGSEGFELAKAGRQGAGVGGCAGEVDWETPKYVTDEEIVSVLGLSVRQAAAHLAVRLRHSISLGAFEIVAPQRLSDRDRALEGMVQLWQNLATKVEI